jgi:hypothetical protein
MSPNLRPNIFWLKVRTKISQPSICVPTFTQFTNYYDGLTSRRTAVAAHFEEWVEL